MKYLNILSYVEVIMLFKGMYDYFIYVENLDKIFYDINDIELGCGFELDKFFISNNNDKFLFLVIDIIEE